MVSVHFLGLFLGAWSRAILINPEWCRNKRTHFLRIGFSAQFHCVDSPKKKRLWDLLWRSEGIQATGTNIVEILFVIKICQIFCCFGNLVFYCFLVI